MIVLSNWLSIGKVRHVIVIDLVHGDAGRQWCMSLAQDNEIRLRALMPSRTSLSPPLGGLVDVLQDALTFGIQNAKRKLGVHMAGCGGFVQPVCCELRIVLEQVAFEVSHPQGVLGRKMLAFGCPLEPPPSFRRFGPIARLEQGHGQAVLR